MVFWPKREEKPNSNQDEIVEEDSGDSGEDNSQDGGGEENPEEQNPTDEIYATEFKINLPANINILVGTKVELLSGCVEVAPNEMKDKIKIEIIPRYNSNVHGLKFENNELIASIVGSYNLKLSVPRSKQTNFSETILVTVYEDKSNAHIVQINNNLIIGENISINNLFNFTSDLDFSVETDNKISYSNYFVLPKSVGESIVKFAFTEDFVKYFYEFNLKIKDQPLYEIILNNVINNEIIINLDEDNVAYINYSLKNREEEYLIQPVMCEIENENILSVKKPIEPPLIKIIAKTRGETTVKLICIEDETVFVEIKIIVN